MAKKTKLNYAVFDENQDFSDIVKMFTKKTKRVNKIFEDNDDDIEVNDKSYGLRLVTLCNEGVEADKSDEKENDEKRNPSIEKNAVKALSPVPIVQAPAEQISEIRSPFKQPSQKLSRQNISLRRSLFQQPTGTAKPPNIDMICSTPCTSNRTRNDFFGSASRGVDSLSPIKKGLSNTVITEDDLNGFQIMQADKNKATVPVETLQNLETDLRQQFEIPDKTPKKSYSKSVAAEKSTNNKTIASPSSLKSCHSEPILQRNAVKNCHIALEPMDISKEVVSMYRKTQLSRLSTSNRTNINSFNMVETPIVQKNRKSVVNDSLLARKLALCESDQELTEDDSDRPVKSQSNKKMSLKSRTEAQNELTDDDESEPSKHSNKSKSLRKSQRISKTQNHDSKQKDSSENDTSDSESQENNKVIEDEHSPENSNKSSENVSFRKEMSFKKPLALQSSRYTAITSNLSPSQNTLVPPDIIRSFRTLQKPTNETTKISEASKSLKISMPKGKGKKKSVSKNKVMDYIQLEKEVKKGKGKDKNKDTKKRTLYHQRSIIDSDEEQKHQPKPKNSPNNDDTNDSDEELKTTVESIRQSLEVSVASSQPFEPPDIPIVDIPNDDDEDKNNDDADSESEESSEDEQTEDFPQEEIEVKKARGRPKKVQSKSSMNKNKTEKAEVKKIVGRPKKVQITSSTNEKQTETSKLSEKVDSTRQSDETSVVSSHLLDPNDDDENNDVADSESEESNTAVADSEESSEHEQTEDYPPEEVEEKKSRGRPKKVQSIASTNEKKGGTSKSVAPVNVESKKERNRKRHSSTVDVKNEPPKKTYRRIARNNNSSESEGEQSKGTDEGFQSQEDDLSVRYDPYKNGCQRPGLRVRKYMRPYWIHSGENVFISYGVFTKKDAKASALQAKYHIKNSQLGKNDPMAIYAAPSSKLKEIQKLAKKRVADQDSDTKTVTKKSKMTKKVTEEEEQQKNQEQEICDTETVASYETAHTARTHAGFVNRIFENFNEMDEVADATQTVSHYTAKEYDLTQINRLVWVVIDPGVLYSPFKEGHFDGFMKFEKGAVKKKAKTKHSVIKMTLLCGKIDILVNQVKLNINNLGFITIKRGQTYSISNTNDDSAIILLTRLDAHDLES